MQAIAPQPAAPQPPSPGVSASEVTNVAAIRAMRRELSNQLVSAANRRSELVQELRTAPPASVPGLEARIRVLDERIVQLESEIARTGQQLTANPMALVGTTRQATSFGGLPPEGVVGLSIVFTIFVLAPLAFAAARLMWRRARYPRPALPPETSQRLERIEQSVEAVAIEVERVTEGQRFLTRLLTEAKAPVLGEPSRSRDGGS